MKLSVLYEAELDPLLQAQANKPGPNDLIKFMTYNGDKIRAIPGYCTTPAGMMVHGGDVNRIVSPQRGVMYRVHFLPC